jgi:glycosyltransferase involved in cell wall biosynthesis
MNGRLSEPRPIKVAVLSSASGGGAGIAARRVTDALNLSDAIEADFLDMVALGGRMPDDAAPPGNMSNRRITDTHFTVEFPGHVRGWLIDLLQQYDILNIHWASFLLGLAEIDELSRRGMPILFTCHDYYYFTGGCHYPATCDKLAKGCIGCPQVNSDYCSPEVITRNRKIKSSILSRHNVHLSAPSAFLVKEAVQAGIVPDHRSMVLRNPYSPIKGLNSDTQDKPLRVVLLADSMTERRKAMPMAIEALRMAFRTANSNGYSNPPFVVEIIGSANERFMNAIKDAGFDYRAHGKLTHHEEIAKILDQSHLLLTCSLEDNWPNVLVEAGAYGVVPIVGPGHGCEEFVNLFGVGHVTKGYNAQSFSEAVLSEISSHSPSRAESLRNQVIATHAPEEIMKGYALAFDRLMHVQPQTLKRDLNHAKAPS